MQRVVKFLQTRTVFDSLDQTEREQLFFIAVVTGNINMLKDCIASGIDVNVYNEHGSAALHLAAVASNYEVTRALFSISTINKNIYTAHWCTPLQLACVAASDIHYINYLLSLGVDPNLMDRLGRRAIQYAVEKDYIQVVQWLIDCDAEVNVVDDFGNSPLSIAILDRNNFDMASLLLRNKADPCFERGTGTPFLLDCILACRSEQMFKNLLLLFKYSANHNVVHPMTLRNCLHYASLAAYKPVVKELLKRKVDLFAKDFAGKTPTDIAREHGNYEIICLYVECLPQHMVQKLYRKLDFEHMKRALSVRKGGASYPSYYLNAETKDDTSLDNEKDAGKKTGTSKGAVENDAL